MLRHYQKKIPSLNTVRLFRVRLKLADRYQHANGKPFNWLSYCSEWVGSHFKFISPNLSIQNQPASAPAGLVASDSASSSVSSSDSDRRYHRRSSTSHASSATSETGSLNESDEDQGQGGNKKPEKRGIDDGKDVVLDIIPLSKQKGFVLFGVQGAKRLQPARIRLSQIDVENCKDDDGFFDELAVEFRKLRGFFRWALSIWQFRTCDFIVVRPNQSIIPRISLT